VNEFVSAPDERVVLDSASHEKFPLEKSKGKLQKAKGKRAALYFFFGLYY
jgi:hypothetical protein